MTNASDSTGKAAGLIARIRGIILKPDAEWAIIDTEQATIPSLYLNYILILAAIGPIATFLHSELFGFGTPWVTYRPSLAGALSSAIVSYVLTLAGVYVMAIIVDALAPSFQGQKNQIQAFKLVTYAYTASWLAGAFLILPGLSILAILGLYSLYLFYRGLPVMMKSPPDKSLAYTAVVIVVAIIISVVIGFVARALMPSPITTGAIHIEQP